MGMTWCEKNGASVDVLAHDGGIMIEVERTRDAWVSDSIAIFVTPDEAREICRRIEAAARDAETK